VPDFFWIFLRHMLEEYHYIFLFLHRTLLALDREIDRILIVLFFLILCVVVQELKVWFGLLP